MPGPKPDDLTGRRFGAWTVLYMVGSTASRQTLWKCRCECGVNRMVQAGNLRSGQSVRCRSCASRIAAFARNGADKSCTGCGATPDTRCRICQRPMCHSCMTDHHHEGYGTPAD